MNVGNVGRNAHFGAAGARSALLGETHRLRLGTQQNAALILNSAMPPMLVVDDQPGNIHALHQLLADDCEVSRATSGAQALAFCAQQLPDLILLDVPMPEMSGDEVCERLEADPRTQPALKLASAGRPHDHGFATAAKACCRLRDGLALR